MRSQPRAGKARKILCSGKFAKNFRRPAKSQKLRAEFSCGRAVPMHPKMPLIRPIKNAFACVFNNLGKAETSENLVGRKPNYTIRGKAGKPKMKNCKHASQIRDVQPHTKGCEECLKMGDDWVHLRLCMTCGHVGCCDSSKNKHATKHFHSTKHPIIKSHEPGEDWGWCYVDEVELAFS